MADPVVVCVVVAGARLAYSLVMACTSPARERARAQALATLLRAAGPGGVVECVRRDGSGLIARSAPVIVAEGVDR